MVFWQNGSVAVKCLIQSEINRKQSKKRENGKKEEMNNTHG